MLVRSHTGVNMSASVSLGRFFDLTSVGSRARHSAARLAAKLCGLTPPTWIPCRGPVSQTDVRSIFEHVWTLSDRSVCFGTLALSGL